MLRPILRVGDSVLGEVSQAVSVFDAELQELIDDMTQTMYAAPGVGLAAVQVGVLKRVAVIDVTVGREADQLLILVNPTILHSDGTQDGDEGCLSLPGTMEPLARADRVEFQAQDRRGEEYNRVAEGLFARVVQHEIDHMDGQLFYKRLGALKRRMVERKIKKNIKTGSWS